MLLPQELVNDIVSHIDHGKDLQVIHDLLLASSAIFSPQICHNLHRLPVHLKATNDYSTLSSISALSADILPNVHILRIDDQPFQRLLEPRERHLPTLLDRCTGLRNAEWSFAYPEQHRRALYRAMQRQTLVSLSLTWIKFQNNAIMELGGLTLPPNLKSITLSSVSVLDGNYFLAQPVQLDGGASGIEELQTDVLSLPFARLMYRPPRPYPYGNLRALVLSTYGGSLESPDPDSSLLRANPLLSYLHLRTELNSMPSYDLSDKTALRTLVLHFYLMRTIFSVANIVIMLRTFPRPNSLERVHLIGITTNKNIEEEVEHWQAMDDVLASEEQFPALGHVHLHLSQRRLRRSNGEEASTSPARGVLELREREIGEFFDCSVQ
ncbi:hypothetical protein BD626DRAFT_507819 [Schizophyllum amplum]|uniref:F-box domain-containing protein n=1 Tax=Schizophyllum amplum TaxID=97359 RepID=A0A550C4B8_9AGAR|nr:hypothetical protein BD626DRAFT_507819 [Auriculariopsis ampla]